MQTRQELILDFMKQMAGTEQVIEMSKKADAEGQKACALKIYLMAAVFADQYLERV